MVRYFLRFSIFSVITVFVQCLEDSSTPIFGQVQLKYKENLKTDTYTVLSKER